MNLVFHDGFFGKYENSIHASDFSDFLHIENQLHETLNHLFNHCFLVK